MTTRSNPFGSSKPVSNENASKSEIKQPFKKGNLIKSEESHPETTINNTSDIRKQSSPKKVKETSNVSSKDNEKDEIIKKEYEKLSTYNSSLYAIRPTITSIPSTPELLKDANVPFGITINPLSKYIDCPLIEYENDAEIPRCDDKECKAYISPFIKFIDEGDKWICNFCGSVNTTKNYYFEKFDKSGDRKDRGIRPEISVGSYEFIANSGYINKLRPQVRPTFVFVIDVSLASSVNGFLTSVIESIKAGVNEIIEYTEETRIAIITYDTSIHFYNLNSSINQPQMFCINESNIFLPLPESHLLVSLEKSKSIIISTLDMIQNSFNSSIHKDSNKLIDALDAAYLLSKSSGGKVLVFNASQSIRDHPRIKSTKQIPQEELIYSPTDEKFFSQKGITFTNNHISIDLFIASEQYINLITLNQLCDYTNGNLHFFKKYRMDIYYKSLYNKIYKTITGYIGFECVMRTRISGGYKISSFITPVLISNVDLMVMSSLDEDHSYSALLELVSSPTETVNVSLNKDKNRNKNFLYIQSAVLYTPKDGKRRIRVHNFCLPLTNKLSEVHNSIDSEALSTFYTKQLIDKIFKTKKMVNSILSIEDRIKSLLGSVFTSNYSLSKELPPHLEYIPIYFLGLIKNRIACKDEIGMKMDIDIANYIRFKILRMKSDEIINFLYPKFYQIHHLLLDPSLGTSSNGYFQLPDIINPDTNSIEQDGIYLIDNGFNLLLYVKLLVSSKIVSSLFKVNSLNDITMTVNEDSIFAIGDEFSNRLQGIIEYLRSIKSFYQPLLIIFESTESERFIKECLIMDNLCPWMKNDYIVYRNNIINESISNSTRGTSLKK